MVFKMSETAKLLQENGYEPNSEGLNKFFADLQHTDPETFEAIRQEFGFG